MNLKYLFFIMIIFFSIFALGCTGIEENNTNGDSIVEISKSSNTQKLEIIHFHATRQCTTCITVGNYAEETINTYFANEVKSGKITFASLNAELPENQELVKKYGVTGASLWLGVYTVNGNFSAEENVNVWYKTNNKEEYMNYLKGIIEQKLAGN